jgi:hypothetical protein
MVLPYCFVGRWTSTDFSLFNDKSSQLLVEVQNVIIWPYLKNPYGIRCARKHCSADRHDHNRLICCLLLGSPFLCSWLCMAYCISDPRNSCYRNCRYVAMENPKPYQAMQMIILCVAGGSTMTFWSHRKMRNYLPRRYTSISRSFCLIVVPNPLSERLISHWICVDLGLTNVKSLLILAVLRKIRLKCGLKCFGFCKIELCIWSVMTSGSSKPHDYSIGSFDLLLLCFSDDCLIIFICFFLTCVM